MNLYVVYLRLNGKKGSQNIKLFAVSYYAPHINIKKINEKTLIRKKRIQKQF